MLFDSDKIIIVATAAGFASGLVQSLLDDYLKIRLDGQIFVFKRTLLKSLYAASALAVIFGVMIFALANWETKMSQFELYRYSIAMAIAFSLMPFSDRVIGMIFARLKNS